MNDFEYKVSVIIPVYNAEKSLAECMESLVRQSLEKDAFEVIAIDDGSKDKSVEICKLYQGKCNLSILQQENIIECWLAKARVGNKSYDLRIVYVNGEIVWRVVRTSSQPITNLHLQNEAIRFADLNLPAEKVAEIDTLCLNAMKLYPDVHIAGLDVLLTQKLTPYIIEINGQGDLIYQDTCEQNKIYQRQIQVMREHHV